MNAPVRDREPILRAAHIRRVYGDVTALADASITLERGLIHGLVGENGAGKSTLVRILAGIEKPDAGTLTVPSRDDGAPVRVAIVPQYPRMAASLPLWQNILIGAESRRGPFLAARLARKRLQTVAEQYDIVLDVNRQTGTLGGTELRLAALLGALVRDPDLLILDEPTVGLSRIDQNAIVGTLQRLRQAGTAVLFISHDLREVTRLSDRVTPLIAGKTRDVMIGPVDTAALAAEVFGRLADETKRSLATFDPDENTVAPHLETEREAGIVFQEVVLRDSRAGRALGPLTLTAMRGRITAITGVRESGLDLIEHFFSGTAHLESGAIRLSGRRIASRVDPATLRRSGLSFIPTDRFEQAAALEGSVEENAILQDRSHVHPLGWLTRGRASSVTHRLLERFSLEISQSSPLTSLSGGTIQKLILSRELDSNPTVCVIAEPSAGLDLESQRLLGHQLVRLAEQGSAVVILSSSLDSVCDLAEQIIVLHDGSIAGTFQPEERESILQAFAGIGTLAGSRDSAIPGCT